MAQADSKTDVAVIGAGPGGYAAAFLAADLGLSVTLIDPEVNPGGVCLYRGCIPTKALLHASGLLEEAQLAEAWGIKFGKPKIDVERLRGWKDEVVARLTGGLGTLVGQRKLDYRRGRARFLEAGVLEVAGVDGKRGVLRAGHTVIATGTVTAAVPGLDFSSPLVLDSTGALELKDVPSRLLVIGAGFIGLELGSVYAALGSAVTVAEMMDRILPMADADLVRVYLQRAEKIFSGLLTGVIAECREEGGKIKAVFRAAADKTRVIKEETFDKVLVTVGRKPNVEGLGLEATGVERDEKGFIKVDEQRRTTDPLIFAVGDITGGPLLAHKASHEGRVAARVLAGRKAGFDPRAIPSVEYTNPEIAWCGLTENEAREQGLKVTAARFPWAASGRAATLGHSDGLTKLIIDSATERVLGAGIVGTNAGELIAETALAVEMGALASDLAETIHPHPSLSETVMEAAQVFYGDATSIFRPRR